MTDEEEEGVEFAEKISAQADSPAVDKDYSEEPWNLKIIRSDLEKVTTLQAAKYVAAKFIHGMGAGRVKLGYKACHTYLTTHNPNFVKDSQEPGHFWCSKCALQRFAQSCKKDDGTVVFSIDEQKVGRPKDWGDSMVVGR